MFRNFSRYLTLLLLLLWIGVVQSATVKLSIDETSVSEGNFFTLTVSLDISPSEDRTALGSILVSFRTDADKSDFSSLPSSTTLDLANPVKSFAVLAVDDNVVEVPETFTFKIGILAPNGNVTVDDRRQSVSVTIKNPGKLQFTESNYRVDENGESVTITVERVDGKDGEISVNYATSDGTAIVGTHYHAAQGTLTWVDKDSNPQSFTVAIIDDSSHDGDKTLNLSLSEPLGGATLGLRSATVTIKEQVDPGKLQFTSSDYFVDENGVNAIITVKRVDGSNGEISVNYATSDETASDETAIAGTHYHAAQGTLTWADKESNTSKSFTVTIIDNESYDGNKTLKVNLSLPSGGATLGSPADATVFIKEDEPPNQGKLQFTSFNYTVGENGESISITVERVKGSDGEISVNYATSDETASDETAIAGTHYHAAQGTLTWADKESNTSKSFTVTIIDNLLHDGDKTLNLSLSDPSGGAILGLSEARLTIEDDETPLAVKPNTVTLMVGNSTELNISGGTPPYEVISLNEEVATVSVSITDNVATVTAAKEKTGTAIIKITDQADASVEVTVKVILCEPLDCIEGKPCLCFYRDPNKESIDVGEHLTLSLNLIDIQNTDQAVNLYVAFALPKGYMIPLVFLTEEIGFVTEFMPFKVNIKQEDKSFTILDNIEVVQCLGGIYTYYAGLFFHGNDELASNLAIGKVTFEKKCE